MNRYLILIFLAILLCVGTVVGAAQSVPTIDTRKPLEILSQQLEVLQQDNKSIFSGDVVATQGDMTLSADKLIVFFVDENTIERLEATGNVRFSQLDRTATAEKAVYLQEQGVLSLIGKAHVEQGMNTVAGDEIVFYTRENRSVVKGSSQKRVKAVIVQEEKKGVK